MTVLKKTNVLQKKSFMPIMPEGTEKVLPTFCPVELNARFENFASLF